MSINQADAIASRPVHIVRISSDIVEDDYEEGLGRSTGCGLNDEPVGRTFQSLDAAIEYLGGHHGLPSWPDAYEIERGQLITARACADHSQAQNGGWFDPTPEETEAWKAGKMKLYSEEYRVEFFYR